MGPFVSKFICLIVGFRLSGGISDPVWGPFVSAAAARGSPSREAGRASVYLFALAFMEAFGSSSKSVLA